jgi:hypothetical protein
MSTNARFLGVQLSLATPSTTQASRCIWGFEPQTPMLAGATGKTIHLHPTLGESIGMAAEIAHGS